MLCAVALTGGIGSGKTMVAGLFNKLYNVNIISADRIAKEIITLPHFAALIIEKLGNYVANLDGSINRKNLRDIIIHNSATRSWLNSIIHPVIRQKIKHEFIKSQSLYTIIEIPLLTSESLSYYPYINRVISVFSSLETKITRIMLRDNQTRYQALAMIKSQVNDDERQKFSDFVINNDFNTIKFLLPQIKIINQKVLSFRKSN